MGHFEAHTNAHQPVAEHLEHLDVDLRQGWNVERHRESWLCQLGEQAIAVQVPEG